MFDDQVYQKKLLRFQGHEMVVLGVTETITEDALKDRITLSDAYTLFEVLGSHGVCAMFDENMAMWSLSSPDNHTCNAVASIVYAAVLNAVISDGYSTSLANTMNRKSAAWHAAKGIETPWLDTKISPEQVAKARKAVGNVIRFPTK